MKQCAQGLLLPWNQEWVVPRIDLAKWIDKRMVEFEHGRCACPSEEIIACICPPQRGEIGLERRFDFLTQTVELHAPIVMALARRIGTLLAFAAA